jgi:organic hydroperoxide reductase OsmC/OhrA
MVSSIIGIWPLKTVNLLGKPFHMADHIQDKNLFQASVIWLNGKKGMITSSEVNGTIHVETAAVFGGKGKPWTPEHLFLGSLSSCFMSTFLGIAERLKLSIDGLSCRVSGVAEMVNGRPSFTRIDVYPDIYIEGEGNEKKAHLALQKTHKECLVTNSISSHINYHSSIRLTNELKEA